MKNSADQGGCYPQRPKKRHFFNLQTMFRHSHVIFSLACVASVSVEFGSKERPRNGVFGILPARKMGREPKKERWG